MSVYEKGLVTILACSALFALVSLPLVFRKVPRNGFHGYRTRATLGSDCGWKTTSSRSRSPFEGDVPSRFKIHSRKRGG